MNILTPTSVRAYRMLAKWSQKDLAETINMSEQAVRFYEAGRGGGKKLLTAIDKAITDDGGSITFRAGVLRVARNMSDRKEDK